MFNVHYKKNRINKKKSQHTQKNTYFHNSMNLIQLNDTNFHEHTTNYRFFI